MNNSNNNRSILVLDDELDITTIAKQYLQGLGFRVSAFTDPLIALEYFVKFQNLLRHGYFCYKNARYEGSGVCKEN